GPGKLFTDTQAKWIWCNSAGGVSASIAIAATFTTTFLNTVAGAEALLNIIVDDIAEIYLNGVYITKVQWGWNNAEDYTNRPVRLTLATGTNTLSIRVQNTWVTAAALLASLVGSNGSTVLARTSNAWTYTVDAMGAPNAVEIYPAGSSPYGTSNIGPGKLFTDTQAKWIWCNSAGGVSASIAIAATFTTTFLNTVAGAEALLNIIVDDIAEIYLNGVYITKVQWGWNNAEDYTNRPVRLTLATGTNTLSIRVQNTWVTAAALLASLVGSNGSTVLARTSNAWTYTVDAMGAPNAVEIYPAGSSPYGTSNIGPGKLFTDTQAKWIWCNLNASSGIAATFTTTFLNTVAGAEALLNIIVDDIGEIYLNGVYITKVQWGWKNSGDYANRPVHLALATGTNTLSICVQNTGGLAALLASLVGSDGCTIMARTSNAWTYTLD
ncbi:hypothetical protein Vretifemale_10565, partial [Volvox reticuliferus]